MPLEPPWNALQRFGTSWNILGTPWNALERLGGAWKPLKKTLETLEHLCTPWIEFECLETPRNTLGTP